MSRQPTAAAREAHQAAKSASMSAAKTEQWARARAKAVLEIARWPNGVAPMAGLTEAHLQSLLRRGLVERRYVLTVEGKREAARLAAEGAP